jgi:hypothetical protein
MLPTVVVFAAALGLISGLPSMRDSLTNPVHVYEGDDALITCVVRDIGENTIMWKKEDRERHSTRVLTAVDKRVTADKRFAVLHDSSASSDEAADVPSGGDVWVLVIKNAKPADSGVYVCEVNSNPIVRSFHKLSGQLDVLSRIQTLYQIYRFRSFIEGPPASQQHDGCLPVRGAKTDVQQQEPQLHRLLHRQKCVLELSGILQHTEHTRR